MADKDYIKATVPMPKDMVKFLHNMGLGAKTAKGGYKLPKSSLVRAICKALEEVHKKVNIDLSGAKTEHEVEQRILKAIKKYKG